MTSQDALDAWQAARKPLEPLLPRKAGSPDGTQETCHRFQQPPHRWLHHLLRIHYPKAKPFSFASTTSRTTPCGHPGKKGPASVHVEAESDLSHHVVRYQCLCLFCELPAPSDSFVPGFCFLLMRSRVTSSQLDTWPQKKTCANDKAADSPLTFRKRVQLAGRLSKAMCALSSLRALQKCVVHSPGFQIWRTRAKTQEAKPSNDPSMFHSPTPTHVTKVTSGVRW